MYQFLRKRLPTPLFQSLQISWDTIGWPAQLPILHSVVNSNKSWILLYCKYIGSIHAFLLDTRTMVAAQKKLFDGAARYTMESALCAMDSPTCRWKLLDGTIESARGDLLNPPGICSMKNKLHGICSMSARWDRLNEICWMRDVSCSMKSALWNLHIFPAFEHYFFPRPPSLVYQTTHNSW